MKKARKYRLNKQELIQIGRNGLIFSAPAALAFLMALQGSGDIKFALGAGYSALLGLLIDAYRKLLSGK